MMTCGPRLQSSAPGGGLLAPESGVASASAVRFITLHKRTTLPCNTAISSKRLPYDPRQQGGRPLVPLLTVLCVRLPSYIARLPQSKLSGMPAHR